MMDAILNQRARSTLLPPDMATAILDGNKPTLDEIVTALVIGAMDCQATVVADTRSTLNEKRIARACATIAFLTALANTFQK